MPSSLATQLAQGASLNATLLKRNKPTESYLFTGKDASAHDLDSIHALAYNAFVQLSSLDSSFSQFEESLFSHAARATDRTLVDRATAATVKETIQRFLVRLGPWLLEQSAGRIIEWLVRRFRINEFDVESVIALFLPYHESPHFVKMLSILHIPPNSTWSPLTPHAQATTVVPRHALVKIMVKSSDIARFTISLLPNALKGQYVYRTLIAFNAAVAHDFLNAKQNLLKPEDLAYILPAILEPLQKAHAGRNTPAELTVTKEATLGSFILLATLSRRVLLTQETTQTVAYAMTTAARRAKVGTRQYLSAIVAFLEPQKPIEMDASFITRLQKLPKVQEELVEATKLIGYEKFMGPMISELVKRLDQEIPSSIVTGLITLNTTPASVVARLTRVLLGSIAQVEEDDTDGPKQRALLSMIHQRHPSVLRSCITALETGENKESLNQLLLSLSIPEVSSHLAGGADTTMLDAIVESSDADESVRVHGVTTLVNALGSSTDDDGVVSALLGRISDSSIAVLSTLYGSHPSELASLFSKRPEEYLSALSSAIFSDTKIKRPVLRLHVEFLVLHIWSCLDSSQQDKAYWNVVFPYLLFTKPRQHSASLVWELCGSTDYDLLEGCGTQVEAAKSKGPLDEASIWALDEAISTTMAKNILASPRSERYIELLLAQLVSATLEPHTLLLALLVVRQLLLAGGLSANNAYRIVECLSSFSGAGISSVGEWDGTDGQLALAVVLKPSSHATSSLLQLHVLLALASLPHKQDVVTNWLVAANSGGDEQFTQVHLLRRLFEISATSLPPRQHNVILQKVAENLQGDVLAFFVGIWVGQTADNSDILPVIALNHTLAFLKAQSQDPMGAKIDFQTIVPSFVAALANPSASIRKLASQCIAVLSDMASKQKFEEVYLFDTVYGAGSTDLKYLSQDELKTYLEALVKSAEHFGYDQAFVHSFHTEHLGSGPKEQKGYRRSTLCYLLSHAAVHASPVGQLTLLRALGGVSDASKAKILLPVIRAHLARKSVAEGGDVKELEQVLFGVFDGSIGKDLTKEKQLAKGGLWETLKDVTTYALRSSLRHSGFFKNLCLRILPSQATERQAELALLVLSTCASDPSIQPKCQEVLQSMLVSSTGDLDASLLLKILTAVQEDVASLSSTERPLKRARVSTDTSEPQDPATFLARISVIVQVLTALPATPPLKIASESLHNISRLLEILSQIAQGQAHLTSGEARVVDVDYVEQTLMTAIERLAQAIQDVPDMSTNSIRLEVIVDLIRSTSNSQTLSQSLQLISALARLSPSSVLGHVMPIFTFMGANASVWQRDDLSGWGVVRMTIDSIVPVMAAFLKDLKHAPGSLELFIASRDFLRVFADASTHIPKHRRTSFFVHLTNVLGPSDFLVPLVLLLVQQSANRIAKSGTPSSDIQTALSLPLSLLHHYPTELQVTALSELANEAQRLTTRVIDPESSLTLFLDDSLFDEHSAPPSTVYKRRAVAVLTFIGFAVRSASINSTAPSSLVASLIQLASLDQQVALDIPEVARQTIRKVLSGMSVTSFLTAALTMINSDNDQVRHGALELLGSRIPVISSKARSDSSSVILDIVNAIQGIIKRQLQSTSEILGASFSVISAVCASMQAGEEGALTSIIPLLVTAVRERKYTVLALEALSHHPSKLGPRLLPHFREIVTQLVSVVQDKPPVTGAVEHAAATLRGLLTSIPTFWSGTDLKQALQLCLGGQQQSTAALSNLPKVIAKRIPATTLLPCVVELWASVERVPHLEKYTSYFELLHKSLRAAPRTAVDENQRAVFQVFIGAFDRLSISAHEESEPKEKAILAFVELVSKLNENTFRPLLRKLSDWAFRTPNANDSATNLNQKQVMFCDVYLGLLDNFKGLMNSYLQFLAQAFSDILKSFPIANKDMHLWSRTIQILSQSFQFDEGVYWRDDKIRSILPLLQAQVPICATLGNAANGKSLRECYVGLLECASDEVVVKSINLDLLMHTRSEEVSVRILALSCAEAIWTAHGGKLLGYAPETATFIAECNEDENDKVVKESFKLKDAVESVAGNLNI